MCARRAAAPDLGARSVRPATPRFARSQEALDVVVVRQWRQGRERARAPTWRGGRDAKGRFWQAIRQRPRPVVAGDASRRRPGVGATAPGGLCFVVPRYCWARLPPSRARATRLLPPPSSFSWTRPRYSPRVARTTASPPLRPFDKTTRETETARREKDPRARPAPCPSGPARSPAGITLSKCFASARAQSLRIPRAPAARRDSKLGRARVVVAAPEVRARRRPLPVRWPPPFAHGGDPRAGGRRARPSSASFLSSSSSCSWRQRRPPRRRPLLPGKGSRAARWGVRAATPRSPSPQQQQQPRATTPPPPQQRQP